jgi:hypothetical protein
MTGQSPDYSDRLAVNILDEKKREVVHEDLDAWFVLCHAKFYLLGTYPPLDGRKSD